MLATLSILSWIQWKEGAFIGALNVDLCASVGQKSSRRSSSRHVEDDWLLHDENELKLNPSNEERKSYNMDGAEVGAPKPAA